MEHFCVQCNRNTKFVKAEGFAGGSLRCCNGDPSVAWITHPTRWVPGKGYCTRAKLACEHYHEQFEPYGIARLFNAELLCYTCDVPSDMCKYNQRDIKALHAAMRKEFEKDKFDISNWINFPELLKELYAERAVMISQVLIKLRSTPLIPAFDNIILQYMFSNRE